MKKLKNILKRIGDWFIFLMTCTGNVADEAEELGICYFGD